MSTCFTVITRYHIADADTWMTDAREALEPLARQPQCLGADICAAVDDPQLFAIVTRWPSVGDYRRAMSDFAVKLQTVPLLSQSIDEPTTFEVLHHHGPDGRFDAVSARAEDADRFNLGDASASPARARLSTD